MLTFGSCITFVLPVDVPPLARYLLMQMHMGDIGSRGEGREGTLSHYRTVVKM